MLHDKIKPIAAIAAIAVAAILIFTVINTLINRGKGTVELNIVPSSAKLSVDAKAPKTVKQGQSLKLNSGNHVLVFNQDGFQETTINVDVKAGDKQTVGAALIPINGQSGQLTEEESIRAEGIAGIEMNRGADEINRKFPMVNALPINRLLYTIYPGKSLLKPDDPTAVGIYIKAPTPRTRQDALEAIRLKGYDPSDYEIIFSNEERR